MRPNSPMISWKWITGFGFISISFVSWWIRFWVTLYQVSTNRRAKECCARAHAFVLFTVGRECVKIINIKWTAIQRLSSIYFVQSARAFVFTVKWKIIMIIMIEQPIQPQHFWLISDAEPETESERKTFYFRSFSISVIFVFVYVALLRLIKLAFWLWKQIKSNKKCVQNLAMGGRFVALSSIFITHR